VSNEDELRASRLAHAKKLEEVSVRPFPNDLVETPEMRAGRAHVLELAADEGKRASLPSEADITPETERFPLYGRVMAKRGPFVVFRTPFGDAQALVRPEHLSAEDQTQLAALDLADHAFVRGPVVKTGTGALAVKAFEFKHVSKAMLPPPAKWHGLKDVEIRYRERYVDLFANPDVLDVFKARTTIVKSVRAFFDSRDFIEVETPLLHSVRGGATARSPSTRTTTPWI
jgi:lysyl-tRNA synthetase class 2